MRWITCRLSVQLKLPTQNVAVLSGKLVAMPYRDIGRLVSKTRAFVERLTELPMGLPHHREIEPFKFVFVPMELDFVFACIEGDVTKDLEGLVSLRIMANLSSSDNGYGSEYAGVETSADPRQVIEFASVLEQEADYAINSGYEQIVASE